MGLSGLAGMDIEQIMAEFERLAEINRWQPLHTADNLSRAILVEAGELAEECCQDNPKVDRIGAEIADVLMYLLALSKSLNIDVEAAIAEKQASNRQRFSGHQE